MILFCDTSALVKLYIREAETDRVLQAVETASVVAVCRIAWAEAMAALARRARETTGDAATIEVARGRLHGDWDNYAIVEVTQPLVELAGDYADTFALRAYDSIQLAAAATLHAAADGQVVRFACFDQRLQKAAGILGLQPV